MRWVVWMRDKELKRFGEKAYEDLVEDGDSQLIYPAPIRVNLNLTQECWPAVEFLDRREPREMRVPRVALEVGTFSSVSCSLAQLDAGIYAVTVELFVIDTSVFVAGLRSQGGASRELLRRALIGDIQPLFGNALWLEYQDLLGRDVWGHSTTPAERLQVLAALAQKGRWVTVYYGWRPNLPDEADNHLIELALAGGASAIVTHNVRDLVRGELRLGKLRILTPAQCLEECE